MRMSQICNESLLQAISEDGIITYDDLRKKYLPPEQPGVIQERTVMFDRDLKTLEEEGLILRENNTIRYIERR